MANNNVISASEFIDPILPKHFDAVSTKLREFFKSKGMLEAAVQHRLSILAACEDPTTISCFEYAGNVWPLPQTGQMNLEWELLTHPEAPGYFCYTTSYRAEPNPVPGRHNIIFPMIEFEIHGGMDKLLQFEHELLVYLGYDENKFKGGNYVDVAREYGHDELDHADERRMCSDSPVFFLKHFPFITSPFWNMRADFTACKSYKVDVIMSGIETIGSAERSCNTSEMRELFYKISDGKYAEILFAKFGRERVEKELDAFLGLNFIPRAGGGIGVGRLIRSMLAEGLLEN